MRVKVKGNLPEVMEELEFDQATIDQFKELIGQTFEVHNNWFDGEQEYVTIDLCVELPRQACEYVA